MAFEIVSFPMKNGESFHSYRTVYQRFSMAFPWLFYGFSMAFLWFKTYEEKPWKTTTGWISQLGLLTDLRPAPDLSGAPGRATIFKYWMKWHLGGVPPFFLINHVLFIRGWHSCVKSMEKMYFLVCGVHCCCFTTIIYTYIYIYMGMGQNPGTYMKHENSW